MRPLIVCAVVGLVLGGCIHPGLSLDFGRKTASASSPPGKPPCPGGLLADLEPVPPLPDGAGFPSPATPEEGAAVAVYGAWLHAFAVWAKDGWQRAADAKTFCAGKP